MQQQILFIHGAGDDAWDWSAPMIELLNKHLGASDHIHVPRMPHPEKPSYALWKTALQQELEKLDSDVILIGHSLGASVVLKYLQETKPAPACKALFLLAAPFWGKADWDVEEFTLQKNSPVFNSAPVFIYHNEDDEDVPFEHHTFYQRLLPAAHITTGRHGGHAMLNLLPAVAKQIQAL
jgi:hypothetical protein